MFFRITCRLRSKCFAVLRLLLALAVAITCRFPDGALLHSVRCHRCLHTIIFFLKTPPFFPKLIRFLPLLQEPYLFIFPT